MLQTVMCNLVTSRLISHSCIVDRPTFVTYLGFK